jgi:hypothetical protein
MTFGLFFRLDGYVHTLWYASVEVRVVEVYIWEDCLEQCFGPL